MKIKATLLTSETPIIKIQIGDKYYPKSILTEENVNIQNGDSEKIISRHLITEGLVLLDTQMYYTSARTVNFEIDEESVVMNFIYSSNVETHIDQLESEKYSKKIPIIFSTPTILKPHLTFLLLRKSIICQLFFSKEFYYNIINEDWQLPEKFSQKILEKQSSYLTSKYLPFTPAIQWVTSEIKNCTREGLLKEFISKAKSKSSLSISLKP